MSASSNIASSSFNDYNAQLQSAALKATRAAVALPIDIPFHRSVHPEFARELDECSAKVLSLTNKLLSLSSTLNSSNGGRGKGKARLELQDDVVDNFRSLVVDAMDQVLERADIGIDEFLGNFKAPAIVVNPSAASAASKPKKPTVSQGRLDPALQHASHIAKPQLSFKRKVDNNPHTFWTPSLRHKYNAQVPLGHSYTEEGEDASSSLHPYRYEIKHLSYPSRMFAPAVPVPPRSYEETPFTWVSTPVELAAMLDKLRGATEIAIDLEYHNYRTFGGFVCLMQISTREEDFVVDTLILREELEDLNEVFTNPNIVKVLHGAESDIVWLQQDFNLYIVNLFDTYHASKVLDFPKHGLASLLDMYCDFTADKRYQLADWRIRPLPEEMLQYARSDTHFLLFIYDNLRNALLDRAQSRAQSRAESPASSSSTPAPVPDPSIPPAHVLVREVLARSEETALRVYEKEVYDAEGGSGPGGWDGLARKWNKIALMAGSTLGEADSAMRVQRAIYLAVHAWRDRIAREEDESTRYVLPNHYLFSLAERTPADMAALLTVFRPVPAIIRRRSKELLDTIREAVKNSLASSANAPESQKPSAQHNTTPTADADVEMASQTPAATSINVGASLWASVSGITASSSALFGPSLQRNAKSPLLVASQSALFSGPQKASSNNPRDSGIGRARFLEAAMRIHSTLVIAPTVPKIASMKPKTELSDSAMDAPEAENENVLKMEVEIPFVPSAQRARAAVPQVDDTIVVVGQPKRKRKRKEKAEVEPEGSSVELGVDQESRQENGEVKEEVKVEAFDYTSVPNILDSGDLDDATDAPSAKKKRKQKGSSNNAFYGNFPAPPKAHSQVKSGNQSRTFR